jgi:Fe-S cluster assembly iron-binding protein IscA
MLTVTDRAKERLFEQKQAARIEQAKIGLRVSADSTGQWMLIADHARNDDQVVVHNGSTVLLIDPLAQSVLEGAQVDCVATADGEMELVLGAAPDEDDDDLEEGEAWPSTRPFGR